MNFLFTLWPPCKNYWDEICSIIDSKFEIINKTQFEYLNENWNEFIVELYKFSWELIQSQLINFL